MTMAMDLKKREECTLETDLGEHSVWMLCAYNKPLRSKKVKNLDDLSRYYWDRGIGTLPLSYPRKSRRFCLSNVYADVYDRFIELLAPMTLQHLRQSCKQLYYQCLDLRGLEFNTIYESEDEEFKNFIMIHPYSGMLYGYVPDPRFTNYQIAHGSFMATVKKSSRLDVPRPFFKKYKSFILFLDNASFDDILPTFWDSMLHPGVQNAYIRVDKKSAEATVQISIKKLKDFFGYCTAMHKLQLVVKCASKKRDLDLTLTGNPPFSEIKNMVENWSKTAANLETFVLSYKNHYFQLDCSSKTFKRCVRGVDKNWSWSDNWDIDAAEYDTYPEEAILKKSDKFCVFKMLQYYDDVIKNYQQYVSKRTSFSKTFVNKFKRFFTFRFPKQITDHF